MNDLKNLDLSENDFNLIIEGLETLPEKGAAGEMMGDMLSMILTKDDDEKGKQLMAAREKKAKDKEATKAMLREDIRILQGKLLLLKRFLKQEGALRDTYEIVNNPDVKFYGGR